MIEELVQEMFAGVNTQNRKFPQTEVYNETWMLRLLLSWQSLRNDRRDVLPFDNCESWFSEANLPSPFSARSKGDKRSEQWTHSDCVIGDFEIRKDTKAGIKIIPEARHLYVIEAKIFSRLSRGVTNAPYYNQAARTVACMAELLHCGHVFPGSMTSLGFYVFAPEEQIERGVFRDQLDYKKMRRVVKQRYDNYNDTKDKWYESWFLPTLEQICIEAISWESIIKGIGQVDREFFGEIREYYKKCIHYNRPRRASDAP